MSKKKTKKTKNGEVEIWTEEQYEEYLAGLYGMEYIAGFTEGGIPYGVFRENVGVYRGDESNYHRDFDNELPFYKNNESSYVKQM